MVQYIDTFTGYVITVEFSYDISALILLIIYIFFTDKSKTKALGFRRLCRVLEVFSSTFVLGSLFSYSPLLPLLKSLTDFCLATVVHFVP